MRLAKLHMCLFCTVLMASGCTTFRKEYVELPSVPHVGSQVERLGKPATYAVVGAEALDAEMRSQLNAPARLVDVHEQPDITVTFASEPSVMVSRREIVTQDSGGNTAYQIEYRIHSAAVVTVTSVKDGSIDTIAKSSDDIYTVGSRYDKNVLLGGNCNGRLATRGSVAYTTQQHVRRYEAAEESQLLRGLLAECPAGPHALLSYYARYGAGTTKRSMQMISSTEDEFTKHLPIAVSNATTTEARRQLISAVEGRRALVQQGSDEWGMFTIAIGVLHVMDGNQDAARRLFQMVAHPRDFVGSVAHDNLERLENDPPSTKN